ncbi:MAG: ABC transporter permease [Bifidobacteriaceae bacterium]|jgi:peptide/nickel transport system permease protein|nr:ABC transporter permease [Bifidobacteriaceae bacterium]
MLKFIAKRAVAGAGLLFLIPSLAFALMHLSSDGVARQLLGRMATQEQIAAKTAELGLDKPFFEQYINWLGHALQGDLGASWYTSEPVFQALTTRLPVTLSLVGLTTIIAAVVSIILGLTSAIFRGWLDKLVQIVAIVGFALPGFWLALVLVTALAVRLGWFPATGYVPFGVSLSGWAESLTLPVLSLSLGAVAAAAQQIRSAVIDVLRQDWVRTLRSRGLPRRSVIFKHVLRSAGVSGLTVLGLQFVGLIGGAVFVERIFALPGIGQMIVQSTSQGDVPFVLGVVVVTTIIVVVVNLLIDLGIGFLNPKARLT